MHTTYCKALCITPHHTTPHHTTPHHTTPHHTTLQSPLAHCAAPHTLLQYSGRLDPTPHSTHCDAHYTSMFFKCTNCTTCKAAHPPTQVRTLHTLLRCNALYCTVPHFTQQSTALHCTTLHYTTLHYTTLHYTTLHYAGLRMLNVVKHRFVLRSTASFSENARRWRTGR